MPATKAKVHEIPISTIKIQEERFGGDKRDKNIGELAESIQEYGLIQPIVLSDEHELIAGYRRLCAHVMLGRTEILAHFIGDLDELDRRLIELEENIRREQLDWQDQVAAVAEIERLRIEKDPNWSRADTAEEIGKTPDMVNKYLQVSRGLEKYPELAESKTLTGALQALKRKADIDRREEEIRLKNEGKLTAYKAEILHGKAEQLITTLEDESIDAIVSNFPFGVNLRFKNNVPTYEDDPDEVRDLIEYMIPELYRVLKPNAWAVLFWDVQKDRELRAWAEKAGFKTHGIPCVWAKPNKTQGRVGDPWRDLVSSCEFFWFFRKGEPTLSRAGVSNLFIYDTPLPSERVHPAQMPTDLCADLVKLVTVPGELVLDPFAGSGAVGLGCLDAKREFLGFEADNDYCTAGNVRLAEHTYAQVEGMGEDGEEADSTGS